MATSKKEEDTDPRHVARAEELARQKLVTDAIAQNDIDQRKAAEQVAADQAYYEIHGIRRVEGKP